MVEPEGEDEIDKLILKGAEEGGEVMLEVEQRGGFKLFKRGPAVKEGGEGIRAISRPMKPRP